MLKRMTALLLAVMILAGIALLSGCGTAENSTTGSTGTSTPTTTGTTGTTGTTTATQPSTAPTGTTAGTQPSSTPTGTTVVTQPSTVPTQATKPSQPSGSDDEMIGELYTRSELMALNNDTRGYGPGPCNPNNNNRAEYAVGEQNRFGQYGANFIAPDNGKIYLTFDCGYEYTTKLNGKDVRVTEWILDILKKKNVKAVFFVTMYYCKQSPDLVQRMVDEGHAVGNHSNNHPDMTTISIDKAVYEVMSLHEYVEENFGYKMTLFRPPTGNFSARSLAIVQSLGYKNVHWSFAYTDWLTDKQPDVTSALNTVTSKAHSGAIYLLHAVSVTNATILGDAIDAFIDKGFNLELFQ